MRRYCTLLILIVVVCVFSINVKATTPPCDVKYEYRVIADKKRDGKFELFFTFKDRSAKKAKFFLVDLMNVTNTKEMNFSVEQNVEKSLFSGLKQGHYMLHVRMGDGCSFDVNGRNGIAVK
ncbi:hypothetical protein FUAX_22760 [Fulvitalea axinellae]|uniref:GOLD domain-containing protein n=1 Tax=Fulvitalea axinellae TaxID=1182444 RepID=A0AAU9D5S0_9BACT|nr:hypothetical protein FUAX_22760 [Fulvitalea axinellae]